MVVIRGWGGRVRRLAKGYKVSVGWENRTPGGLLHCMVTPVNNMQPM
jgi:hypothetical protein